MFHNASLNNFALVILVRELLLFVLNFLSSLINSSLVYLFKIFAKCNLFFLSILCLIIFSNNNLLVRVKLEKKSTQKLQQSLHLDSSFPCARRVIQGYPPQSPYTFLVYNTSKIEPCETSFLALIQSFA